MNVLIIDDDEVDCISICKQISSVFNCDHAQSEEEALLKIKKQNYDCILLDYRLKNITGLELLPKIQAICNAPIIFVTGQGSEYIAVEALKNGAKDYIVKAQMNYKKLIKSILATINESKATIGHIATLKNIQQDIANRINVLESMK